MGRTVEKRTRRTTGIWRVIVRSRMLMAITALLVSATMAVTQQRGASRSEHIADVYRGFILPPNDARPMVRWWWFGAAIDKTEILRELKQMKLDGIGGVELAFEYPQVLNDPASNLENLPFLSAPMLSDVAYAQAEGRRLGLRVDVTLGSGWPYGGPSTTLANAAGRLRIVQVQLGRDATTVPSPPLREGDVLISAAVVNGEPAHWDVGSARTLKLTSDGVVVPPSGTLRTVLFFIAGHSRQQVKRAAVGAEGYVLDPFSHTAVATYLNSVGEPLVKAFGNAPPYAIFSDSLETYGADWTADLPSEFLKRRGYDLVPHLTELMIGGSVAANTVRHDYGRTLTELINENYLTQINDWAMTHRTRFRSQTYGTPAVSFSSQNLVSLAEGEGPRWREFSTLRWATSANHVFGHNITSGETFTWLHSPVFRATPLDMKAEADIDFIMGENQLIFHGWPYSPRQVGNPGWSLYAAAALNDHNPWHPVMPSVTKYISRLSYLMRQGKPSNQVAVLLPTDDAWARFSPGKVSITDQMKTLVPPALIANILSAGYNIDFTDADAINSVGIRNPILVLPPTDRIPVKTLEKIAKFASDGGKVIGVGRIPSMSPEGGPLKIPQVCNGAAEGRSSTACRPLFDTETFTLISDPSQLSEALNKAAQPDLQLIDANPATRNQLGFIRRRLASADIYFVVNTSNRTMDATVTFATTHRVAEQWNPDTTVVTRASATSQRIHVAPYESSIFVFSDTPWATAPDLTPISTRKFANLSNDWKVTFPTINRSINEHTLSDWTTDPTTLHYSGEAIYKRDFTVAVLPANRTVWLTIDGGKPLPGAPNSEAAPESVGADGMVNPLVTHTGPGMRVYYDPPIREAALIEINGRRVGALWHPPYVLDVTKYLKPGKNQIKIRVFNTALNAWSALPPHNYAPLIAKYGDRFQMQDMDKVRPISSGLLGSIYLVSAEEK